MKSYIRNMPNLLESLGSSSNSGISRKTLGLSIEEGVISKFFFARRFNRE